MTCYCKVAVVSHAYNRPVAGGQISRSRNQEELLEAIRESHDSRSFEPGVDDIQAKIDNLCRMDSDSRKDKIGEGLILTSQVKIFLNGNGFVRLVQNSKSFSAIQQNAVYISEDGMLQLIQLARTIGTILLSTSSTTEMSKDPMSLTSLLKFILSDNRPMPRFIFSLSTLLPDYSGFNMLLSDGVQRGKVFAPYLASDLILRALSPTKQIGVAIRTLTFANENYSIASSHILRTSSSASHKTSPPRGSNCLRDLSSFPL
jgi:hypothetical protein